MFGVELNTTFGLSFFNMMPLTFPLQFPGCRFFQSCDPNFWQDLFIKSCRKRVERISEDDLFVDGHYMSEKDMIDEKFPMYLCGNVVTTSSMDVIYHAWSVTCRPYVFYCATSLYIYAYFQLWMQLFCLEPN